MAPSGACIIPAGGGGIGTGGDPLLSFVESAAGGGGGQGGGGGGGGGGAGAETCIGEVFVSIVNADLSSVVGELVTLPFRRHVTVIKEIKII